jgi:hypothetical protein
MFSTYRVTLGHALEELGVVKIRSREEYTRIQIGLALFVTVADGGLAVWLYLISLVSRVRGARQGGVHGAD